MITPSRLTVALIGGLAAMPVQAQQTQRLRGVIENVDGSTILAKSDKGDALKLHLAENVVIVGVVKATVADIKQGSYIGSGGMPQPDGSQKAVELRIFPESMRGTGEGFRPWSGATKGTMTNGTVGATVTSVDGPVVTVKYKDGEQRIVVGPNVPIMRYEIEDASAVKPGVAFAVRSAVKTADGSYDIKRINVGRDGVVPR